MEQVNTNSLTDEQIEKLQQVITEIVDKVTNILNSLWNSIKEVVHKFIKWLSEMKVVERTKIRKGKRYVYKVTSLTKLIKRFNNMKE